MKNFSASGDLVTLTAPVGGVVSGTPKQIGQLLVVPTTSASAGAEFVGKRTGLFAGVPKAGSQAWAVGALVYWDEGNDRFTTSAAGNLLAGFAAAAVGSGAGETTGDVILDGTARVQEDT